MTEHTNITFTQTREVTRTGDVIYVITPSVTLDDCPEDQCKCECEENACAAAARNGGGAVNGGGAFAGSLAGSLAAAAGGIVAGGVVVGSVGSGQFEQFCVVLGIIVRKNKISLAIFVLIIPYFYAYDA